MGRDLMKAAAANGKCDVAAMCDSDEAVLAQAREAAPDGIAEYAEYADMLAAGGLDGIVVATPQYVHAEHTIAGLEAGCCVFCEKPMAMNVTQCESMLAASASTGKPLMVGQVLRYIHVYRFVLETAVSGEYGEARAGRVIRTSGHWGEPWLRPWRLKYETCGGMLPEVNVHEIDLMLRILRDDPMSVCALGRNFAYPDVDYEDFITAQVAFAGGGIGSVTSVCSDWVGRNSGEFYFDNGTIYYDNLSAQVHLAKAGQEKTVVSYEELTQKYDENGVEREMREFIEMCLGEHGPTIPGEQGMAALEVCQAAYLSAREGRIVELPLPRG